MTQNRSRKLALDEYKRRTPSARGAFAVRCPSGAGVWVGASSNLDAARNGLWFMLRTGSHRDPGLQAAWNTYGEDAFAFEVLETLDPDAAAISVSDLLKEKKREWAAQLDASVLL